MALVKKKKKITLGSFYVCLFKWLSNIFMDFMVVYSEHELLWFLLEVDSKVYSSLQMHAKVVISYRNQFLEKDEGIVLKYQSPLLSNNKIF